MSFDRNIIAIDWRAGRYSVLASETFNAITEIDWAALELAHPLADVGGPTLYDDKAAVLSPDQLREFVRGEMARRFVDVDAKGAFVFLVHRAELLESGLPDD